LIPLLCRKIAEVKRDAHRTAGDQRAAYRASTQNPALPLTLANANFVGDFVHPSSLLGEALEFGLG
jgi:hypothetical protein